MKTESQYWLQRLLEEKSKGMDKNSKEYLDLTLVASTCLRPSSALRKSFITMVEKRRGSLAAKKLNNDARRFWNEAKDLQQMRQEQNA